MSKRSHKSKLVRVSASELKPPTPEDLDRLRRASEGPIDTSDMPELTEEDFNRLQPAAHRRIRVRLPLDRDIAAQVLSEDPARINQVLRDYLEEKRKAG